MELLHIITGMYHNYHKSISQKEFAKDFISRRTGKGEKSVQYCAVFL